MAKSQKITEIPKDNNSLNNNGNGNSSNIGAPKENSHTFVHKNQVYSVNPCNNFSNL